MARKTKKELRHSWWAKRLRQYLYYLIVDRKSWPLTFEPPAEGDRYTSLDSPNLYVHLPFCEKICHYCPYVKFPFNSASHLQYAQSLMNEVAEFTRSGNPEPIESLYFGGGSPSLSLSLVEQVLNQLRPHFADKAEVAIELHPSHCDPKLFRKLKQFGITKLSIGVESFSAKMLKILGRRYSPEEAKAAVIAARQQGFDCVDVNLIYAISQQTLHDVASDVRTAISLGADQISAYPLFAFRHTGLGKSFSNRPEGLAAIRERVAIQQKVADLCCTNGYQRTSVWSFARSGVAPYTTVTRDSYRGFGVGAGSKIDGIFWFNSFSLDHYLQADQVVPALVMRTADRFQRFHWLYWKIYCIDIDPSDYRTLYGRELEQDFRLLFVAMQLFGWLKRREDRWMVTERGAIFAHLFQSLFSLSYIDILWTRCQSETQPQRIVLE